jgi:hypothetical protein
MAISLKKKHKCNIRVPAWMTVGKSITFIFLPQKKKKKKKKKRRI